MKIASIFTIGFLLGFASVAYTVLAPADSFSAQLVLAGPETDRLEKGEEIRTVLFLAAAVITVAALVTAFLRAKVAAVLWTVVLVITLLRALLPSAPAPQFPFAVAVFWCGLAAQVALCYSAFRLLRARTAEPGASPNGGPAVSSGNSGVTDGPPSVS
jgi:hypothetical protein